MSASTRKTKIVIIGAGSVSFGPSILGDLFSFADQLRGAEVWLVDTNAESLDVMQRYAERMNDATARPYAIHKTTERTEALPSADFVIVSVAVDRLETWKLDWQIPLKHGVRHVLGENGGPGGLSHALRNIPLLLSIAKDIEMLAPKALLLNFTNPMTRLCMAVARETNVKFVGLCHQIGEGYRIVNKVLQVVPTDAAHASQQWHNLVRQIEQKIHITAAGLNHFTFILDVRDRETGADLYPALREKLAHMPADFELMSRRLMDTFGLFCATGDGHAGEYVGFAADTIPLTGYDFNAYAQRGKTQWQRLRAMADGAEPVQIQQTNERALPIIDALLHDLNQHELSANLLNDGCISNLPANAVVEVPAVANARGVHGVQVGALPRGLAALMRNQIELMALVVEAGVKGDRKAALQALLLDPVVHSYAQAEHMLDELLRVHKKYLPQFA
jgi:alpha-galactosidase